MFGLTPLGLFHTAISLIAVISGLVALVRDQAITPDNGIGKLYIVTTVVTCLTAFGIFQHGGFGKAHVAAVITLAVLAVAALAGRSAVFGRASRYVETIAYSFTFFIHLIPGVTETATRLPLGAPLLASPDDPALQGTIGALFVVFVIGAVLQVLRLRETGPIDTRLSQQVKVSCDASP
jgi:uncharacterized membrane protein